MAWKPPRANVPLMALLKPMRSCNRFFGAKEWFNQHLAMVTSLLLPLEAAAFKLAFRRFRQIKYPEWLVICAFLTAQTFVIWALSVPLQR